MIRLIGVLSEGGVSVHLKTNLETRGEILLGALIEATKTLSTVMGSGEVSKLDFQDRKLIVTEGEKGYTVVALVDKAEDYMDTFVRVISDEIDKSEIAKADGVVTNEHMNIVDGILNMFVVHQLDVSLPDMLEIVWKPLKKAIGDRIDLSDSATVEERTLEEEWEAFKSRAEESIEEALSHARNGDFDKACASSQGLESQFAKMFAVKMAALSMSMTKTQAPPVDKLRFCVESLVGDDPFVQLTRAIAGRVSGECSSLDYSHAYRHAAGHFKFEDDEANLLLAFLFVDINVDEDLEFAQRLIQYFADRGYLVVSNYISAILERSALFDRLYSITSYDDFRDDLGVWKHQIEDTLEGLDRVLKLRLLKKILMRKETNELGLSGALKLQNYIALLTALAESPVLTINERKKVLEEIIYLYQEYFRKLFDTDVPLFAYTIDSVFQSLSVANAEFYQLSMGAERQKHLQNMVEFLQDILRVVGEEGQKRYVRFSLFVVANAICPTFAMAEELSDEEMKLMISAMGTTDVSVLERQQILYPLYFATSFSNMASAFAAMVPRMLVGTEMTIALNKCVSTLLNIQAFFMTHGVVCRDDLMYTTYHAAQALGGASEDDFKSILRVVIALNRVAIQDPKKFDYEVAMMGKPLIDLLVRSWRKLGNDDLRDEAIDYLEISIAAWKKYGFPEKASELQDILKMLKS